MRDQQVLPVDARQKPALKRRSYKSSIFCNHDIVNCAFGYMILQVEKEHVIASGSLRFLKSTVVHGSVCRFVPQKHILRIDARCGDSKQRGVSCELQWSA